MILILNIWLLGLRNIYNFSLLQESVTLLTYGWKVEGLFALHVYYATQLMYAVDMYIGYFLILTFVAT